MTIGIVHSIVSPQFTEFRVRLALYGARDLSARRAISVSCLAGNVVQLANRGDSSAKPVGGRRRIQWVPRWSRTRARPRRPRRGRHRRLRRRRILKQFNRQRDAGRLGGRERRPAICGPTPRASRGQRRSQFLASCFPPTDRPRGTIYRSHALPALRHPTRHARRPAQTGQGRHPGPLSTSALQCNRSATASRLAATLLQPRDLRTAANRPKSGTTKARDFGRVRLCSRAFAETSLIGATGSTWLSYGRSDRPAIDLQWRDRAETVGFGDEAGRMPS